MGRPNRQLIPRLCLLGALTVSLPACTTLPRPAASSRAESSIPADGDRAVTSPSTVLLAQSRAARAEGNLAAAATALERALRIEPNDPLLWLEYARLRMDEGDYGQAETLARKSASLAGSDRAARAAAEALAADAGEARGH